MAKLSNRQISALAEKIQKEAFNTRKSYRESDQFEEDFQRHMESEDLVELNERIVEYTRKKDELETLRQGISSLAKESNVVVPQYPNLDAMKNLYSNKIIVPNKSSVESEIHFLSIDGCDDIVAAVRQKFLGE